MENGNAMLVAAMARVELVILSLTAKGITVQGVALHGSKPVIRVSRHAFFEKMIRDGKASYQTFGCSNNGKYKQGVFIKDECRVVWSESLH